jgi:hypothetical protein
MSTEENYRQKAAELRLHARRERNVSSRIEWELLALGYDRLADQARRNARNKIVYEYDPEAVAKTRQRRRGVQVQQQQPQQPKRDR